MNGRLAYQMMSRPIRGLLGMLWRGGGKEVASVWASCLVIYTKHDWSEIEDTMIIDSDFMESQDNCNDLKGHYLQYSKYVYSVVESIQCECGV